MKIPLAKPDITNLERKAVLEVLKTPYLSLGPRLKEFEKKIAKFVGVKYAIATNSGTSALHLIIRAFGIKEGDEVITTPFSFISSANCILYEGAKPVFIDINEKTLNIDPNKIESKITKKTKAILAVDVFGHPADWDELSKIARKHKLFLIEDSAEALGAEYKGKKCGSFGDTAILSFYPNKQITTGEGGMVVTNNKKIADLCKSMVNQGRKTKGGKWLEHVRLGYNYRLDELSCALGISQLKRINEILKKRERVAKMYNERLGEFSEVEIPYVSPGVKMSWFVYVIRLSKKYSQRDRDKIIKAMAQSGIQCGTYFQPIHLQSFYRKKFGYKSGDFPICESVSQRTIALPFFNNLKEKEINYVVKNLRGIITKLK
ncbi:MAG: GDP-perosamine synthase [Dehalococcoidia bacterium]|nr:GDP-perosamine synthase [Bacillota bacterium]